MTFNLVIIVLAAFIQFGVCQQRGVIITPWFWYFPSTSTLNHQCPRITDQSCAVLYDNDDCIEPDGIFSWDPLKIQDDANADISFSLSRIFQGWWRYKDDVEAIVIREGCALQVFKESDCSGGSFTFYGFDGQGSDTVVPRLRESPAPDFGKQAKKPRNFRLKSYF